MPQKTNEDKPPVGDAWKRKELFLIEPKTLGIIIAISVITLVVSFFGEQGVKFMASVINPLPQHAPFDGTTYPVQQVPDWVNLSSAERELDFASLAKSKLITTPVYNPSRLAIPVSNLTWNNPNDDAIRNEKITYSVPYLGNYKLDGLERTGSHAAVDIKTLSGTPVFAIANGVVTKAKNQGGGFGNHVVIQHNNVPTLADENASTTLHSSYSHMSFVSVQERQVVAKGELIGFVGDTGTATTPHLHFQIDVDDAFFHPYWPFNSADMSAAGYSFFEAINKGLGQANGVRYTVNPMVYVQKYFGDKILVAVDTSTAAPVAVDPYDELSFKVQTVGGDKFTEGDDVKFVIQAFAEDGTLLSGPDFTDSVSLSLLNPQAGNLNLGALTSTDLQTGISNQVIVNSVYAGTNKVILRFRNSEFSSNSFEVAEKLPELAKVLILPERSKIKIGDTVDVVLRALGQDLKPLTVGVDTELLLGLSNPIGILNTFNVEAFRFVNGEAKVKFTASLPGTTSIVVVDSTQQFESQTIEVMEPVIEEPGTTTPVVEAPGTDGSAGVITAPPDPTAPVDAAADTAAVGTSSPPEPVDAGAVVIPPESVDAEPVIISPEPVDSEQPVVIPPLVPDPPIVVAPIVPQLEHVFTDIDINNKYFKALKVLKADGLAAGYGDGSFKAEATVTRAEAITFILRVVDEELRENIPNIFPDVESGAWYLRFVTTAFDLGFVKGHPDGSFKPNSNVTIAEFFTMLFEAAQADVDPQISVALTGEYDPNEWYAPYIQEAMLKGVLSVFEGVTTPDRLVTRGEIAQVIFELRKQEGSRL